VFVFFVGFYLLVLGGFGVVVQGNVYFGLAGKAAFLSGVFPV
jgi:hypothetical protein